MFARSYRVLREGLPSLTLMAALGLGAIALSACTTSSTSTSTSAPTSASASSSSDTGANEVTPTETDRLNAWFEQKFEEELQRSPVYLTILGRKEQYDQFDDASEAAEDEEFAIATKNIDELRNSFDYEALTEEGKLPRGKAYYEERLRYSTTTQMSAAEVHQLGLNEVKRLNKDMLAVLEQVNFDGSLQDFFAFIRDGKQFYYPTTLVCCQKPT